ncbi:MAG: FprA family A-type flavoprotein [Eubacteriales bacterium]
MHCVRNITEDLYFLGVDEHRLHLFENIHPIPRGVSYNSYLLKDEKTVLFDTVDWAVCRQFMENIAFVLNGRDLDYLVVNHVEPDHAASIEQVIQAYPKVKIVSNEKAFLFMRQFGFDIGDRAVTVTEGDSMSFGKHKVAFVLAPMVHWPEAMVSFDLTDGTLFAADAFGTFGALNGVLFNDEVDFDRDWIDDARRYYTNIVGKYGPHVQKLLRKASTLPIKLICPLHGPVWRSDFGYILDKYNRWSSYVPEKKGVLIAYASMYGNTEQAAVALASQLVQKGCLDVKVCDVSTTHVTDLIGYAFQYSHMALVSVTYNLGIYPLMHNFIMDMKALNLQNRTVAIVENGTWACTAGKLMTKELEEMKQMTILNESLTISSAVNEANLPSIEMLAQGLIDSLETATV